MKSKAETNVKVTLKRGETSLTIEVNRSVDYYKIEQKVKYPELDSKHDERYIDYKK